MSIIQTKKQSDIEKRLKLLRQQVYGRSSEHSENPVSSRGEGSETQKVRKSDTSENLTYRYSDVSAESGKESSAYTPTSSGPPNRSESFRSDTAFLRQDLIKITSFATVAFGIQVVLYFLLTKNIIKLPIGG